MDGAPTNQPTNQLTTKLENHMKYHITLKSDNVKTGSIPVSTTGAQSCPDLCPLKKNGCYAVGPLGWHWQKVTDGLRGVEFAEFLDVIKRLPIGLLWRHNQAGDLPGENEAIDAKALADLVKANKWKRGFTFTHKPMTAENMTAIEAANLGGFTINLSANNLDHADALADLAIAPVVSLVDVDAPKVSYTSAGRKVVVCPAQSSDKITCATCGLCQKVNRDYIIGFRIHGSQIKKAIAVMEARV
jgi:hypothetical protein